MEQLPGWAVETFNAGFVLVGFYHLVRWVRAARYKAPPVYKMPEPFDPHDFDQDPDFGYSDKKLDWSTGKRKKAVQYDLPIPEPSTRAPVQKKEAPPVMPGFFAKLISVVAVIITIFNVLKTGGFL